MGTFIVILPAVRLTITKRFEDNFVFTAESFRWGSLATFSSGSGPSGCAAESISRIAGDFVSFPDTPHASLVMSAISRYSRWRL